MTADDRETAGARRAATLDQTTYDLATLLAARRHATMYLYRGTASTHGWVARSRLGTATTGCYDGSDNRFSTDCNFFLAETQLRMLADFQRYADSDPCSAGRAASLTLHDRQGIVVTLGIDGGDLTLRARAAAYAAFVGPGDQLLAAYRPGWLTWTLVVRGGIVAAAFVAVPALPARAAAAAGLLPVIART